MPAPLFAAGEPLGCAVTDGAAAAEVAGTLVLGVVALVLGVVALVLGVVALALGVVALGLAVVALALGVVALGPGAVALRLAVMLAMALGVVALRLGVAPAIALLTEPPHPAATHPAARIAAERKRILKSRRMPNPFAHYP